MQRRLIAVVARVHQIHRRLTRARRQRAHRNRVAVEGRDMQGSLAGAQLLPAEVRPRVRQRVHYLDVALLRSAPERRALVILELRWVVGIGVLEPPLDGRQVLFRLSHDLAEGSRLRLRLRLQLRLRLRLLLLLPRGRQLALHHAEQHAQALPVAHRRVAVVAPQDRRALGPDEREDRVPEGVHRHVVHRRQLLVLVVHVQEEENLLHPLGQLPVVRPAQAHLPQQRAAAELPQRRHDRRRQIVDVHGRVPRVQLLSEAVRRPLHPHVVDDAV